MKYAIYDKATDGYLAKMVFDVGYSQHTQFECALTEYITNAELLDTKEAANLVIIDIEGFKFMEKGRFVIHSFDDTLKDQYIISEAGNPTKVVDNITVDLDGAINVKYGSISQYLVKHWSDASLDYVINRMNALQKAKDSRYTAWCNTFDIYKVITVIDEKSCTHYQFINVTAKGLEEYAKNEEEKVKESNELRIARDCLAEVIHAIRNAIYNNDSDAFCCIEDRMKFDHDFNSNPFMAGVRENIKDICAAEKKNIANNDLKNSEIARLSTDLNEWKIKCKAKDTDYEMLKNKLKACEIILESTQDSLTVTTNERDKALERAEKFKGIANSVYGMTTPGRCCGKQMWYDITTGKKIPIDKKKYDNLVEYVANINLTYDNMFCMMDKPVYLSTITESLDNLTK